MLVFILTQNVRYTSNVKTSIFAQTAFLPAETLFLKLITHATYEMKGYWILFLFNGIKFLKQLCSTKKLRLSMSQFCLYKARLVLKVVVNDTKCLEMKINGVILN